MAFCLTALATASWSRPAGLSGLVTTPTIVYFFSMRPVRITAANSGVPIKTARTLGASVGRVFWADRTGVSCADGFLENIFFARSSKAVIFFIQRLMFLFLLLLVAVRDENAVEMVHFVLDDDREQAGGAEFLGQAFLVLVADGDFFGAADGEEFSRQAQAAFFEEYLFLRIGGDFRIDEIEGFAIHFGDRQTERKIDLRSSQADAFFLVHRLDHFRQERLDLFGKRILHALGLFEQYIGCGAGDKWQHSLEKRERVDIDDNGSVRFLE